MESERRTNLLNMGEELCCVGVVTSLHRLVDALHHWLPPGCGEITFILRKSALDGSSKFDTQCDFQGLLEIYGNL